jgi:hypothetical protein
VRGRVFPEIRMTTPSRITHRLSGVSSTDFLGTSFHAFATVEIRSVVPSDNGGHDGASLLNSAVATAQLMLARVSSNQ